MAGSWHTASECVHFDEMWELVMKEFGIADDALPDWPQLSFTE